MPTKLPWPPAASGHQDALDGIRAIAAFAVLLTHIGAQTGYSYTGTPASWVISRGDIGVPIFFSLSGLLLYRPWARAALHGHRGPQVRPYLWRRALRILPVYWAVVLIALPALSGAHARSPSTWAQYLLLLQIYNPHPWWRGTGAPGLAQMWTLSVEVSFYLVLPLIAAALGVLANRAGADPDRRAKRLLTGITMLAASSYAFVFLVFYPSPRFWLGDTLPRLTTWFAAGMAIAVVSVWAQAEPGRDSKVQLFCRTVGLSSGACWLIAALIFTIACTPVTGAEGLGVPDLWATEIKTALYTIATCVIVATAAFQPPGPTRMNRLLGNRVMRFLGEISYGVFLWQFLLIYAFFDITGLKDGFHGGAYSAVDVIGILLAVTLCTVAASAAGFVLIERPVQRLYRLVRPQPLGRHARRAPSPGNTVAIATAPGPGAAIAKLEPRGPSGFA